MRNVGSEQLSDNNPYIGFNKQCTMQSKGETGTLGQLKNFIWHSLQMKGKQSEQGSPKDDKRSPSKLSPDRILRYQNNYTNMPKNSSLRVQEWQKSQSVKDNSLTGNSDYVKMESPKKPHFPTDNMPLGLNKNCDYVNFNTSVSSSDRQSPDYVNMDSEMSGLRSSVDYVNLRPEDPHEPRPLTRMNVTIHDQIWSQEDPRVVSRAPNSENTLLSPPLKHIDPSQYWRHHDPLDVSDTISDKSGSSGDTMIMMTSAEAKRNEANIERSRQQYETRKSKVSDDGSIDGKCIIVSGDERVDTDSVDIVNLSHGASTDELDSILDEGYGTDSRGSTTNSMSTPLSSSLSSLYSGESDPVSRQPHPKLSTSSMKRQIELIPKGRIANFRKVQFTARKTKTPELNGNNNSLQQKIMDLAIIDEETENDSSSASTGNGSEKNMKSATVSEEISPKSQMRTQNHRSKAERTVRWLDEESAKINHVPQPPHIQARPKPALKQNHLRPKSFSGEHFAPENQSYTTDNFTNCHKPQGANSFEDSRRFSSVCNLRSQNLSGTDFSETDNSRQGILKQVPTNPKIGFQRHSVAAPLDNLSNSRALWKSEVDITRSSRNLEFCCSSQIFDRMRDGKQSHSPSQMNDDNNAQCGDKNCDSNTQGRAVFASSADILKIFQTQSKANNFVRVQQRHSFNTLHHRKELQPCEFSSDTYSSNGYSDKHSNFRSSSNNLSTSVRPGILKNSSTFKDNKNTTNGHKQTVPIMVAPSRTKLSPPPCMQPLSLSKLSTLV